MDRKGEKRGKVKALLAWLTGASLDQARDTGLALALICLLLAYWGERPRFLPLAIILLLISMVWPRLFRPLAALWFGLSHLLGTVMSKVLLTIVFFVMLTPIGLIRRWAGADPLQLKKWKKDSDSVFRVRGDKILPQDLDRPY